MKLGLDSIVLDALKELSAADDAYKATFRGDDYERHEAARRVAYQRRESAEERILNLAKAMFPPPPPKPCKPRPAAKPRSTSIVRAANDTGAPRPRRLPGPKAFPAPKVEITIVPDPPKAQTSLLLTDRDREA